MKTIDKTMIIASMLTMILAGISVSIALIMGAIIEELVYTIPLLCLLLAWENYDKLERLKQ